MASAEALPSLDKTKLFQDIVKNCYNVDLKAWQHPTKTFLNSHEVVLDFVKLCNHGKYPIFYVQFKYDPQGQTSDYFEPIYYGMKKANGGWPFSFVATNDNTVINLNTSDSFV